MPKALIYLYFIQIFFAAIKTRPLDLNSIPERILLESNNKVQRNLYSQEFSVPLTDSSSWFGFQAIPDVDNSDELYMLETWAILISSNETVISKRSCSLFSDFKCLNPNCFEDASSLYSINYPSFSSNDATRVNLAENISLGNGAWQINSSILYLSNCEAETYLLEYGKATGQIGLGLSGNSRQHFRDSNPIFSIVFKLLENHQYSGELILGFDPAYVDDPNKAISLPCDLDWKMQVESVSIGDLILQSGSVTMIFDVQSPVIRLSPVYYANLKDYFFSLSEMGRLGKQSPCFEESLIPAFYCMYFGDLQDLPSLVISLVDGTQFSLAPAAYVEKETLDYFYSIRFLLLDTTFSGADYIILGRYVMRQYYILFQQLNNQTTMITLYPLASSSSKSRIEIEKKVQDHSQDEVPSLEIKNTDVFSNKNNESGHSFLYAIITIILIATLGVFSFYVLRKRRPGKRQEESVEKSRSGLELNESSHFVSSKNNIYNDDGNDISEC